MKVKLKLLFGLALLATLPMLASISIATWVASESSDEMLVARTQETLVNIRNAKKIQIESLFDEVTKQIVGFSRRTMVADALLDLEEGFFAYPGEVRNISANEARNQLIDYYREHELEWARSFATEVARLSDSAVLLQYNYIASNSFPPGEKYRLDKVVEPTLYSNTHGVTHPLFLRYLGENLVDDIYLVSLETSEIIYSARKEANLGAALSDAALADSGIGRAYAAAVAAEDQNFIYFSDYTANPAAGFRPALFASTPIHYAGTPTGVLIFQFSPEFVNRIMSNDRKWEQLGLGKTGDTYLVGADRTLRSEKRSFLEDSEAHLAAMQAAGTSPATIESIRDHGTLIGSPLTISASVGDARQDTSGFVHYLDASGNGVLSAFARLDIPGLEWYVLGEMQEAEAQAPSKILIQKLVTYSSITALIMTAIAVLFGWLFALRLIRPVERLASEIDHIETNSDLLFELTSKPSEITEQIVGSMNKMLRKIHAIVGKVSESSETLSQAVANIDLLSSRTFQEIEKQEEETSNIAAEIVTMIDTAHHVADSADKASEAASIASAHAANGSEIVDSTARAVGKLSGEVRRAGEVIDDLAANSNEVGGVVETINGIAEQTNLLALNAAIEAARAGEQGRGFAVVADEVRTLAGRTQESTEEIKKIVESLREFANSAVAAMTAGREQSEKSAGRALQTHEALTHIVESIDQVATLNRKIAENSEQQRGATNSVNQRISVIREIARSNTDAAEQTKNASNQIKRLTNELRNAVAQFKL